eukprot:3338756-Karenia_brevis.AAC.1
MKKKGRRSGRRIVKLISLNLRKMRGKERKKRGKRRKRRRTKRVTPRGLIILAMTMTTTRTWEMALGLEAVDKTQDR